MESKGKTIKMYRKAAGFTQDQLAEMLKVAKTTISAWERDIQSPSFESLDKFCEAVGITMQDFFTEKPIERNNLEENAVWLDSQAEVPDLKALFKRYLLLDNYGKEAVKNLIHNELYRCDATGTLADADKFFIDVRYIDD